LKHQAFWGYNKKDLNYQPAGELSRYLEVVSKPQIMFNGPAWQRHFASDFLNWRLSKAKQSANNIGGQLEPF
jgi:hypothetical protein